MEGTTSEFYNKERVRNLWPEAYKDWVQDWEDTVKSRGFSSTACCGDEPLEWRRLWPIDRD